MSIARSRQDFQPAWVPADRDCILSNSSYGEYYHVVITAEDGKPLYDSPLYVGPGGAVILLVDESGKIGLVRHYRPCLIAVGAVRRFPGPPALDDLGRWVWEASRGFRLPSELSPEETAMRELEEEVAIAPLALGGELIPPLEPAGEMVPDSSVCAYPIPMFIARVRRGLDESRDVPKDDEPINAVAYFSLDEIRRMTVKGTLVCSFTQSVLWQAWARGVLG